MRILGIETATEACSVALFEDDVLLDHRHEVLGRGHAERLVPMIAELPGKGRATQIVVSLGPGSFTGVRIGLATARALGIGWNAEVSGYPTLALVAAMALKSDRRPVTICMNGGHGQWFVQAFDAGGQPEGDPLSQTPEQARQDVPCSFAAGNRADELLQHEGSGGRAMHLLPDAREIRALPANLLTTNLAPIYSRPPDAQRPGQ